jgi:hypothetical protein
VAKLRRGCLLFFLFLFPKFVIGMAILTMKNLGFLWHSTLWRTKVFCGQGFFFWFKISQKITKLQLLFPNFIYVDGHGEQDFHFFGVVLFILHVLLQGSQVAQLGIMDTGHVCFGLQ